MMWYVMPNFDSQLWLWMWVGLVLMMQPHLKAIHAIRTWNMETLVVSHVKTTVCKHQETLIVFENIYFPYFWNVSNTAPFSYFTCPTTVWKPLIIEEKQNMLIKYLCRVFGSTLNCIRYVLAQSEQTWNKNHKTLISQSKRGAWRTHWLFWMLGTIRKLCWRCLCGQMIETPDATLSM